jgi:hypothetical protein
MRALVVGRLMPELGVGTVRDGVRYADVRHGAAVTDALDELTRGPTGVVVLCSDADARAVRREVALSSVALDSVAVVIPVRYPALGIAVLAALVDEAGRHTEPGEQLAFLHRLRDMMWAAVWLPSVAKVESPAPSITQHLRSWLPGSGFILEYGRNPRVLTAERPPLPALDAPAGLQVVHAAGGTPPWLLPALAEVLRPSAQIEAASWRAPQDAYGTEAAAEFVALPPDPISLLPEVSRTHQFVECDGCGLRHAARVCPFCAMAVDQHGSPVGGVA